MFTKTFTQAVRMRLILFPVCLLASFVLPVAAVAAETNSTSVYRLWPNQAPSWDAPTEAERDTTGADGRAVAGRPVVRLGFVSDPQLHVYPADPRTATDTAVIICPGGGPGHFSGR